MDSFDIYKELQPGTSLNGGKYIIKQKIGEGGFGITYTAIQQGLNRAVCIKEYFLSGHCVRNTLAKTVQLQGADETLFEKYREAFVKEAQTLAALHHPGIVEVIDIFDENNTSYMVMPFIEGRSLQSIVDKNGPLPYPEAVNYIAQVANAVGYIHERHILHRDIKPDNIMITADYKAILIDFGSAREFEEDKTQAHTSMVTHGYAPTEQYTRNSRKGAYTDIYAIGATLYFVLTGKVPYEAAARITEPMPEPKEIIPDLPVEANRTIMKAMQLKSQDRHQSIAEFMDDLQNINPSQSSEQALPSTPQQESNNEKTSSIKKADDKKKDADRTHKKKSTTIIVIVTAVLIAASAALYFILNGNPAAKEARDNVNAYNNLVEKCSFIIKKADGSEPYRLLEAKKIIDSAITSYEKKYATEMPDTYCRSSELKKALGPKLKEAANQWAEAAYAQATNINDTLKACEYYTLSLSLFDDPSVRVEARMFNCNL